MLVFKTFKSGRYATVLNANRNITKYIHSSTSPTLAAHLFALCAHGILELQSKLCNVIHAALALAAKRK